MLNKVLYLLKVLIYFTVQSMKFVKLWFILELIGLFLVFFILEKDKINGENTSKTTQKVRVNYAIFTHMLTQTISHFSCLKCHSVKSVIFYTSLWDLCPHLNHTLESVSLETIHQTELSELTLKAPHMEALIKLTNGPYYCVNNNKQSKFRMPNKLDHD